MGLALRSRVPAPQYYITITMHGPSGCYAHSVIADSVWKGVGMRLESAKKQQAMQHGVNWFTTSIMVIFHLGAIAALFFFTWKALFVAAFLWWVSMSLGIGMGYHRLLVHRGYKTPKWVEYFLTICATLTLEGGPIFWVATHRMHHKYSDREGDPHSPVDGKWWSHMGWIVMGQSLHHDTTALASFGPDLTKDRFHVWITKYNYVPVVVLGLLLLLAGGLPFVLWGIFLRTVFGLHATWLVNSATHSWGSRRFATRDRSTNSWWVALLTWGEGWHNNHHAHPVSARHGLRWYEIDFNWYAIWALKKLGLAHNVYVAAIPSGIPSPVLESRERLAPVFESLPARHTEAPITTSDLSLI